MKTITTILFALCLSFCHAQKRTTDWSPLLDSIGQNLYRENGDIILKANEPFTPTMQKEVDIWFKKHTKKHAHDAHSNVELDGNGWIAIRNGKTGKWSQSKE